MSYLGRGLEQVDNISKLDNITFNGGTTYALTKDSSAFTPISSNAILISIDGVIQQGNFSVSGTNIVFNFSPTSSNTCDFIMHYGTGVAFTPADSSITKDKTNFISNSSSSGITSKGDGGSVDGSIALNCSQNSHHTRISSSPHSAYSGNLNFVLPSSHGTNGQFMKTDGSGNLSFGTVATSPVSFFKVYSNSNTNSQSTGSNSFTDIISQAVTPSSSSSKFLVICSVGGVRKDSSNTSVGIRLTSAISGGSSYDYNAMNEAGYTVNSNTNSIQVGFTHFFTHSHSGNQITFTMKFNSAQNTNSARVKVNGDQAEIVIVEFVSSDQ